jgi:hypothetical protein
MMGRYGGLKMMGRYGGAVRLDGCLVFDVRNA